MVLVLWSLLLMVIFGEFRYGEEYQSLGSGWDERRGTLGQSWRRFWWDFLGGWGAVSAVGWMASD